MCICLCSDLILHPYFVDTYKKAREKVNLAIATSNLESDEEEEMSGRKIVLPQRFQESGKDCLILCFFPQENIQHYCIFLPDMFLNISPKDTEIDEPVCKRLKKTTGTTSIKDRTSVPEMPTMPSCK